MIYLVEVENVVVALDEGIIIQIDATVIAGVLILLTISSLSPENLHAGPPSYLNAVGGIYGATAIVIGPFAFSALMAIATRGWQENVEYSKKIKLLIQNKINALNEKIPQEKDVQIKNKYEEELKKLKKRISKIDERLEKYDELKVETDIRYGKNTSLATMGLGFIYLIYIIFIIATSAIPIHT